MKNRIPASGKAGYVSITQDSATVSVDSDGYLCIANTKSITGKIAHADNATQEGSLYNVANVLPTSLCATLGINTSTSEPKDAFGALNAKCETALSGIDTICSGNWAKKAEYDNFSATASGLGAKAAVLDFTLEGYSYTLSCDLYITLSNGNTYQLPLECVATSPYITYQQAVRVWCDGGLWFAQYDDWFRCLGAVSGSTISQIGIVTPTGVSTLTYGSAILYVKE